MNEAAVRRKAMGAAYVAGICMQGLVLGMLLSFALVELWSAADGVRLFRYQNF